VAWSFGKPRKKALLIGVIGYIGSNQFENVIINSADWIIRNYTIELYVFIQIPPWKVFGLMKSMYFGSVMDVRS